jgi:hypothetical protein
VSLISRMRRQKAVYWPPDGGGSVRGFSDPVEIDCRWEDVHELFLDERGTERVSNAKVYVDRDVSVGGLLRLGELATVPYPYDPMDEGNREESSVYEIRKFEKLPDLKVREYLRTALV